MTTVVMTSNESGTVTIDNLSTHTTLVGTVSGGAQLCGTSAEWILEDVSAGGLVPFASFPDGTVFVNTVATLNTGVSITASSATPADIVQNNEFLCEASIFGPEVFMNPF